MSSRVRSPARCSSQFTPGSLGPADISVRSDSTSWAAPGRSRGGLGGITAARRPPPPLRSTPLTSLLISLLVVLAGLKSLTVEESGVQWWTVGPGSSVWYRRWGTGEVMAGVSRHSLASSLRQGPPVPARQVPGRARTRAGDHQGTGALPLRVSPTGVRPHHRGAAHRAGDGEGRP